MREISKNRSWWVWTCSGAPDLVTSHSTRIKPTDYTNYPPICSTRNQTNYTHGMDCLRFATPNKLIARTQVVTSSCPFWDDGLSIRRLQYLNTYRIYRRDSKMAAPSRSKPGVPRYDLATCSIWLAVCPIWSRSSNCSKSNGIMQIRDSHKRTTYLKAHWGEFPTDPLDKRMYSSAMDKSAISWGKNLANKTMSVQPISQLTDTDWLSYSHGIWCSYTVATPSVRLLTPRWKHQDY